MVGRDTPPVTLHPRLAGPQLRRPPGGALADSPRVTQTRTVVDNLLPVLPFVGIALLFWLLFLRPAQRRQQAMSRMQGGLSVGDEVMLTSGIIGVLRSLDEETAQLEVSEGVIVRVVRAAVAKVTAPVAGDDNRALEADPADEPEEN